MKKILAALLLACMVFTVTGCGSEDKVNKIGDTAQADDFKITVNSVRTSSEGFTAPKDGMEYFIIDVTLENVGNEEKTISSLLCFNLTNENGDRQNASITATTSKDAGGTVAAGAKIQGEIAFETKPEGKLTLKFRPGLDEVVTFEVR